MELARSFLGVLTNETSTSSPGGSFESDLFASNVTDVDAKRSISSQTFLITILVVWLPGTVTNSIALSFIIADVKRALIPAGLLLLVLACCDLIAVIFSFIQHLLTTYLSVTYPLCATVTFVHVFFKISSGLVNSMMAVDRMLAICCPFFYKKNVSFGAVKLWIFITTTFLILVCSLPFVGLGQVLTTNADGSMRCAGVSRYQDEPRYRVYGLIFGCLGAIFIIVIVCSNVILVRALLRMNKRITQPNVHTRPTLSENMCSSVTDESTSSESTRVPTFEIYFAKLMLCLATAYLLCGAPYSAVVLAGQFRVEISPSVTGIVHFLGGLLYTVDPLVYTFSRRHIRQRLARFCCYCCSSQ